MNTSTVESTLSHIELPFRPLAIPIDSLNLDPANARLHDEKNLAAIKGSLARFGQRLPLVVQQQGMIVRAGNGRVVAAKMLGRAPPKASQWKPGQSGNPRGRPKGVGLTDALKRLVRGSHNGKAIADLLAEAML